jgi:hypothetical protein
MENEACAVHGKLIEQAYPSYGKHFLQAALGRRGVTAWVEREGILSVGAKIALHVPPQRVYEPAIAA